jgi:hypothetical protein
MLLIFYLINDANSVGEGGEEGEDGIPLIIHQAKILSAFFSPRLVFSWTGAREKNPLAASPRVV